MSFAPQLPAMAHDGRSLRAIKVSIFIFIVSCIIIRSTVTPKHEERVWFFFRQRQQPRERGFVCQGDLKNLSEVPFNGHGLHGIDLRHEFELDRRGRVPRFVSNVSPDCLKSIAVPRGNGSAVVMLALATENQIDFLENWIFNVKKAGIPMAVVGAGDEATFAKARELQISVFRWSPEIQGGFADWGSAVWIMNTWQKVFAVQKIVSWGFDVILSDLDVVWWRDPSIIFDKHPNADMFFSHDGVGTTNTEEDVNKTLLEIRASIHHTINTGMYMVRSTPSSRRFMRVWAARYPEFEGHDQNGIYDIIRVGSGTERHPDDPGVMKSANGSLYHAVLPTYVFANGHSYFVSKLHTVMHADIPFGMHATWTYDRSEGKISRLREIKAWHDPPEYYEGKFITVDLQVPPMPIGYNKNTDTESMVQFHIYALEVQLQQVALGMIFSWSTGRTFIMPKLVCFCEKIWYAVIECRFPDFLDMQFPTPCPMDYYFSLETLNKGAYGIKMDFKEQGFLDNPRVSQTIKVCMEYDMICSCV